MAFQMDFEEARKKGEITLRPYPPNPKFLVPDRISDRAWVQMCLRKTQPLAIDDIDLLHEALEEWPGMGICILDADKFHEANGLEA